MRILFLGDIFARYGRELVIELLADIIKKHDIDFTIANGENAAHGFGISSKIAKQLFNAGVDVITLGNHCFDNHDILKVIDTDHRIVRPYNLISSKHSPNVIAGRGYYIVRKDNKSLLVANLLGNVFMKDDASSPFVSADEILSKYKLAKNVNAILFDIHCEATSEKLAFAFHVDGRVSAVLGTHTHVPTADNRVLAGGSAYQSDVGMCGVYDSVIGISKEASIASFIEPEKGMRFSPQAGEATLCASIIDVCDESGLAKSINRLQISGNLEQTENE